MTELEAHWTTTEMLANADAHTIEERDQRNTFGDMPGRLLRGLYEIDRATGRIQRRSPVLADALAKYEEATEPAVADELDAAGPRYSQAGLAALKARRGAL